jgi:ATP-binding cassette subfamily B protein
MGVIPQQVDLFSGTIIENMALGETESDMSKVFDISKELGILDFIEKLPDAFETQVGENGAMLSGGQKQRIAIARALYKNPEILLMDEATSALDSHSEAIVKKAIDNFKNSAKTVIVIAHRLNTIASADHIIVMEEGKIVEQGKHKELLALNSKYSDLWSKQFLV